MRYTWAPHLRQPGLPAAPTWRNEGVHRCGQCAMPRRMADRAWQHTWLHGRTHAFVDTKHHTKCTVARPRRCWHINIWDVCIWIRGLFPYAYIDGRRCDLARICKRYRCVRRHGMVEAGGRQRDKLAARRPARVFINLMPVRHIFTRSMGSATSAVSPRWQHIPIRQITRGSPDGLHATVPTGRRSGT